MRLVAFLCLLMLTVLTTASAASSRPLTFRGGVVASSNGWGSIRPDRGFKSHFIVRCRGSWCGGRELVANAQRVSLTATPYKGWRFAGWKRGPCKGGKPKCVIDLTRVHPDRFERHKVRLRATFTPVTPGLTPTNPVPIGHPANIGGGFQLRINSATSDVQLTPAAPAGDEYFVANVTATYLGAGSSTYLYALLHNLGVRGFGHHNGAYGVDGNARYGPCPSTPPPAFPTPQISSGQSATGNVCFTVATNDQSTLELFIDYPFASKWTCGSILCDRYWTWFALR